MRMITAIDGLLHTLPEGQALGAAHTLVHTGLAAVDALAPGGGFAAAGMHEILGAGDGLPFLLPAIVARAAARAGGATGWIAWCDTQRDLYPPALAALGIALDRLLVLRPAGMADQLWAVTECLRCPAIRACVAPVPKVSQIIVRRMQLAAERGGGVGILLRPAAALAWPHAAITRWMVHPMPGEPMVQRCSVRLIHGHGGQIDQPVILEWCRETHHVRAMPWPIAAGQLPIEGVV